MSLIDAAITRSRTVTLTLLLIFISGSVTFLNIAKESFPDITIPAIYISIQHDGISPEDAERLLIRPVSEYLKGLDGIKKIESNASLGHAGLTLSFHVGTDIDNAIIEVRERLNKAKVDLPRDSEEPTASEFNLALFPVVVLYLSGNVDERLLVGTAELLRDQIESIPNVLKAEIRGARDEIVDVLVDPVELANYDIQFDTLFNLIDLNNRLIAAGTLDANQGRHNLKLPGLLQDENDLLSMPIKSTDAKVVVFQDVATAMRSFKDATSISRINGQPTITIEISKRVGTNIIDTVNSVKAVVKAAEPLLPEGVATGFSQDQSIETKNSLDDLINNVALATLLVMLVIIATLGFTSSALVGLVIPGAFLSAIMCLALMGYTLNMVVLFALILAVGLLVDGAIVVTEYADRKMADGESPRAAFSEAAQRMSWPIIASTATTLAVFMPLMFWPDIMGEFMKYLPITLIFTLTASLFMALIVVPVAGSVMVKKSNVSAATAKNLGLAEYGDLDQITGLQAVYIKLLKRFLQRPWQVLASSIVIAILICVGYALWGNGIELFPKSDTNGVKLSIHARGDFSLAERDNIVEEIEQEILSMPELKVVYTNVFTKAGNNQKEDTIAVIQIELKDWHKRRRSADIVKEIRTRTKHIAGIVIEAEERQDGPAGGAAIQLELVSRDIPKLKQAAAALTELLEQQAELVDVTNNLPIGGLEWNLTVDRAEASRYGTNVTMVGNMVKMTTSGITVAQFRPDDARDEIDVILRFPPAYRTLDQLDRLTITTPLGQVPLSNFVQRDARERVSVITKTGNDYSYKVQANTVEGALADSLLKNLTPAIEKIIPEGVLLVLGGNQEEQQNSMSFLGKAFGVALVAMAIILVTQFNNFYQAFLILTSVIFSTLGVFLSMLLRGEPFGVVMGGVGVIALAGIVVNNNIVLIDTFNFLIKRGMEPLEAALRTGALRLRPVLLTTITTVLGLLPMVFQLNLNFVQHEISLGSPSSQIWAQLSSAIAYGLSFATLITLFLTPTLLVLGSRKSAPQGSQADDPTQSNIPL